MQEQLNKHVEKQTVRSTHTCIPKCNHTDNHTTASHEANTIYNRADDSIWLDVVVCV